MVKVARLDTMTVEAQISEADVIRVKAGLPSYFTVLGAPEQRYQARLRAIEPAPTPSTTTRPAAVRPARPSTTTVCSRWRIRTVPCASA